MSVRDVFLFGMFAILVPMILAHPYIGTLAWVTFGVMSPHRLTWGVAYDFQFSLLIAILTLVGLVFTREHRKIKGGMPGVVLVALMAWICFTAFFPFNPAQAWAYWERVIKTFAMTGVLLILLHTRRHVELLVWTLVVSLGFYGIKGGIFTILQGGGARVFGPSGSMVEDNNSLAIGLIIVIPLLVHLHRQYRNKWLRLGLAGAVALCTASVLGSWSRGALLGIFAMGLLLWVRSTRKLAISVPILAFVLIAIPAMPEEWTKRMETTRTYEQDASAMGRIVAWETAFNIAKDRFPFGGGFDYESRETSAKYSPDPSTVLVAHSIYFQVLGSQGFVGLAVFLLFWTLVWRQCAWIRRKSRDLPDLRWAFSLASMTQVALVGYAVGGAFLNLAFWDLPYYLFAAVGTTQYVVGQQLGLLESGSPAGPAPPKSVGEAGRRSSVGWEPESRPPPSAGRSG